VDLFLCWLVGPVVLLAVALGLSFGVELISGARVPWGIRPALGLALMMLLAQIGIATDATAELTIPAIVALGAFGLWMGWSGGLYSGSLPGWGILAALGVYVVFGAPVIFSGDPTWTGYIKLDDSATWMGLTDHAFEFGHRTSGFPPSTWEALIDFNAGSGYPVGSFVPMALISRVTGQDVAWTLQPSMAVMAAVLTLMLSQIVRTVISGAKASAAIAFIAGQSSMLLGYSLWGGVKEVAAAALLALAPLSAWIAVRRPESRWPWLIPGLVAAAFLTVLGPGGAVWLVPTMGPLIWVAWQRLGQSAALNLGWKALATAVVASLPQVITPNGFFSPFQSVLFKESELGNLIRPLSLQHLIGIWPAKDFRFDTDLNAEVIVLAIVLGALALYAAYTAFRDGQPLVPAYLLGGAVAFLITYIAGSPWIDGKGMAIFSVVLLGSGLVGAVLLVQRTPYAVFGWVIAALAGGLVLYSSFLMYQAAWLAPRDEHQELEQIGERFAGDGPMLMTEGSIYGPRHFLRKEDAEGAKDLRRRVLPLRDGSLPDDVNFLDTDMLADSDFDPYRLLILRRAPVASRPPGNFQRVYAGTYYEVWEKVGTPIPGQTLIERLPLGDPPDNSAVPDCSQVQGLAQRAGANGTLLAQPADEHFLLDLSASSHPDKWTLDGTQFTPHGSGTLTTRVDVPTAGDWRIWVGGDIFSELTVTAAGQSASARNAINVNHYQPFGPFRLAAGNQQIQFTSDGSGIEPGSGAEPSALGPVVLQRIESEDQATVSVPSSDYRRLCNVPWDWIEAYG
jgi:hypothetical protein